jgi:transcriptional regulator with XRE-family HTH domain
MLSSSPAEIDPVRMRRQLVAASIRVLLFTRRWRLSQLASHLELSPITVSAVCCGQTETAATRRRIEATLRVALWSSQAEFAERLPLIEFFDDDVHALNVRQLISLIKRRGLPLRRRTNRPRSFYLDILLGEYRRAKSESQLRKPTNEDHN